MKPLVAICCCLLLLQTAYSQTEVNANEISSEMYGNPYLIREWSDGNVKFTSGRVVTQFRLRFDCVKNQLLLQFQGSTFAAESKVKEFVLYTGSAKKKDSLVFRKGYPATEKANDNTYYHVLMEDKVQMLRLVSKNIVEEKELIANNGTKGRLEDDEKYFLFTDGKMISLPTEKEEMVKAFPAHNEELLTFINEKKLRFKTHEDYTQLGKKYNELLQ